MNAQQDYIEVDGGAMEDDGFRFWWPLRISMPEVRRTLFTPDTIPTRAQVLIDALRFIATSVRIDRRANRWGLADFELIDDTTASFVLTVNPEYARIASEQTPGELTEADQPRYWTRVVADVAPDSQMVAVERAPDVARYARSPYTYSEILRELLTAAFNSLEFSQFYGLEIEPLAEVGSFAEWARQQDQITRITIRYRGPNLPARNPELISQIRDAAKDFSDALKAHTVELDANSPTLSEDDIDQLDDAASKRELRLTANGERNGARTRWSSNDTPQPEVLRLPEAELSTVATGGAELPTETRAPRTVRSYLRRLLRL